ncbi:MAG: hypothetical protein GXO25_06935 [Euryarchaeota archaeon]|nr:hypothetical protein [Euryarchaeota archaeon]
MDELIEISAKSIEKFGNDAAKTDSWMVYYFKIFVQLNSEETVETEAQVFLDISNIMRAVDNLLTYHRGSILFDSGGKYSIDFDFRDDEHIVVCVRNGEDRCVIVEYTKFLKVLYSLLKEIRVICSSVERPSYKLEGTICAIEEYILRLKLEIQDEINEK